MKLSKFVLRDLPDNIHYEVLENVFVKSQTLTTVDRNSILIHIALNGEISGKIVRRIE